MLVLFFSQDGRDRILKGSRGKDEERGVSADRVFVQVLIRFVERDSYS
jgi:hypothetical protein